MSLRPHEQRILASVEDQLSRSGPLTPSERPRGVERHQCSLRVLGSEGRRRDENERASRLAQVVYRVPEEKSNAAVDAERAARGVVGRGVGRDGRGRCRVRTGSTVGMMTGGGIGARIGLIMGTAIGAGTYHSGAGR
jgi:hypothetical protein